MSGAAVAIAAVSIAVAVDAGTTLAIVAAVGATVSAIGVVTHNQTLAIAGGVIGAVGAIGGLASAAGMFSSAADVAGGSSIFDAGGLASDGGFAGAVGSDVAAGGSLVTPQAQALIDAGLTSGTQSAGISSSVMSGTDILNEVSGSVTVPGTASAETTGSLVNSSSPTKGTVAAQDSVTPVAATDTSVTGTTGTSTALSPSDQALHDAALQKALDQAAGTTPPTADVPNAPSAPDTPALVTGAPNTTSSVTGAPANPLDASVPGSYAAAKTAASINVLKNGAPVLQPSSSFGGIWNFVKGNQALVSGTIQAGAALIGGATDSLKPAQINALNAQANANQAAANLSTQQLANINGPIPVARRTPLVNQPNVTGQVAA